MPRLTICKKEFNPHDSNEDYLDDIPYAREIMKLKINEKTARSEAKGKEKARKFYDKKKLKKIQPWSKLVSRDKAQQSQMDKDEKPPVGAYHPKQLFIGRGCRRYDKEINRHKSRNSHNIRKKKMKKFKFYKKSESFNGDFDKHDEAASKMETDANATVDIMQVTKTASNNNKLRRLLRSNCKPRYNRVPSPVKFNKQLTRKANINFSFDVEGNGLKFMKIPKISTKNKRIRSVSFKKAPGRKKGQGAFDVNPDLSQSIYYPDYTVGRKRIAVDGPSFDSYSKRRPMHRKLKPSSIDLVDVNKFMPVPKRKGSPAALAFEKNVPRVGDMASPLPGYMQKMNNTRTSLNAVTQKMLETNAFSIGRFQSMADGFDRNSSHLMGRIKKNRRKHRGGKGKRKVNIFNEDEDFEEG